MNCPERVVLLISLLSSYAFFLQNSPLYPLNEDVPHQEKENQEIQNRVYRFALAQYYLN